MIKFMLVMQLCSSLTGYCSQDFMHSEKFESYKSCMIEGSKISMNVFKELPAKEVNKQKATINFYCLEVNENKINETTIPNITEQQKI